MIPSPRACWLVAAACLLPEPAVAAPRPVKGWLTTVDGSRRLAPMDGITWLAADSSIQPDVTIDTTRRFQKLVGFGAAITDATAWLLQTRMTAGARRALLRELFDTRRGMGFNVARITIGASDFSQSHYSYADRPGQPDADISPAMQHLIPTLREIRHVNPRLQVIASPWSAPAWMKTGNSLIKGRLRPEQYGNFARYLVSYTQKMKAAGVPINLLTLQNEPHFEPENYPGMRVSPAERADIVANHLGPLMRTSAPSVKLLDWDHNWDEPQSPIAVLSDRKAEPFVDGVAWHCYAGDVSAQSAVRDQFPRKSVWFTECTGGDWSGDWAASFSWAVRNLVIGATQHWAKGVVMWNLALDENHGPHLGGCGNCRGLVTIDSNSGAVTREPEYFAFAHASRFVAAGSERVASRAGDKQLETVAFQDGRTGPVVIILHNSSDSERNVVIAVDRKRFSTSLPAGAVSTLKVPLSH